MAELCAVLDCPELVKSRHLCPRHYNQWNARRRLDPHTTLAGFLSQESTEPEPLVCLCDPPRPDSMGVCEECARLVVTFAHGETNRERWREHYPAEWDRAVQLSMFPDVAPDVPWRTIQGK
jgi:hypothetical protein